MGSGCCRNGRRTGPGVFKQTAPSFAVVLSTPELVLWGESERGWIARPAVSVDRVQFEARAGQG